MRVRQGQIGGIAPEASAEGATNCLRGSALYCWTLAARAATWVFWMTLAWFGVLAAFVAGQGLTAWRSAPALSAARNWAVRPVPPRANSALAQASSTMVWPRRWCGAAGWWPGRVRHCRRRSSGSAPGARCRAQSRALSSTISRLAAGGRARAGAPKCHASAPACAPTAKLRCRCAGSSWGGGQPPQRPLSGEVESARRCTHAL